MARLLRLEGGMRDCVISNSSKVSAFLEILDEDARSANGVTESGTDRPYRHLTRRERSFHESTFKHMGRANQDDIMAGMPDLSKKLRDEGHTMAASQVDELKGKFDSIANEESRGACAWRETQETLSLKGKFRTDYLKNFKEEQKRFQDKIMDHMINGERPKTEKEPGNE